MKSGVSTKMIISMKAAAMCLLISKWTKGFILMFKECGTLHGTDYVPRSVFPYSTLTIPNQDDITQPPTGDVPVCYVGWALDTERHIVQSFPVNLHISINIKIDILFWLEWNRWNSNSIKSNEFFGNLYLWFYH